MNLIVSFGDNTSNDGYLDNNIDTNAPVQIDIFTYFSSIDEFDSKFW